MPELCLSYAPRCRGPRSSPHRVGSEVGSPTPLLVPSPTALLALTLGLPRSPLARSVVSAGILVRPDRADVAASPSFGVGGMQAYVTSAVPLRDSRPTGSNDSRSLSARSLATRDSSRSSLNTSRCVWCFSCLSREVTLTAKFFRDWKFNLRWNDWNTFCFVDDL